VYQLRIIGYHQLLDGTPACCLCTPFITRVRTSYPSRCFFDTMRLRLHPMPAPFASAIATNASPRRAPRAHATGDHSAVLVLGTHGTDTASMNCARDRSSHDFLAISLTSTQPRFPTKSRSPRRHTGTCRLGIEFRQRTHMQMGVITSTCTCTCPRTWYSIRLQGNKIIDIDDISAPQHARSEYRCFPMTWAGYQSCVSFSEVEAPSGGIDYVYSAAGTRPRVNQRVAASGSPQLRGCSSNNLSSLHACMHHTAWPQHNPFQVRSHRFERQTGSASYRRLLDEA